MKISFYEVEDWEKPYIRRRLKKHRLKFFEEPLGRENIEKDSDIISVFIYSKVDSSALRKFRRLKAVVTRSTGFDHIDISECRKRRVIVSNVPSYGENTVAEHSFALILALSRKLPKSIERTSRGNFSTEGLCGFDLKGKTIGIIGLGRIGQHVAKIAKGFEMKILAVERHPKKELEEKFGLRHVRLNEALKKSDIITIHCPLTRSTKHLINMKNIGLLKRGALLINTARGGIIETEALIYALNKGILGGLGLDVLEEEPLIKEEREILSKKYSKNNLKNLIENHILLTFDNVIITPHNAFNSREALQRILNTTIENIECIEKGSCKNEVK